MSTAAVEHESGRYRLSHLGWVLDPDGYLASAEGRAENVIFAMDLNLKTAEVTFVAVSCVATPNEKVRIIRQESLESSEGSFTDESGSGKAGSKLQSSNGNVKKTAPQQPNAPWLNKPKSLEPTVLHARLVPSIKFRGGAKLCRSTMLPLGNIDVSALGAHFIRGMFHAQGRRNHLQMRRGPLRPKHVHLQDSDVSAIACVKM